MTSKRAESCCDQQRETRSGTEMSGDNLKHPGTGEAEQKRQKWKRAGDELGCDGRQARAVRMAD